MGVCFHSGFACGWVDFRVHVLRDVLLCVHLFGDVSVPGLRLGLFVGEITRVLVLDNWTVCKFVLLTHLFL